MTIENNDSISMEYSKIELSDNAALNNFTTDNLTQDTNSHKKQKTPLPPMMQKAISVEAFVVLGILLAVFVPIGIIMGFPNMLSTLFENAFFLLIEICFWIMAITVVIGALSSLLTEFGIISLLNKALSPVMKPIYGMPGASAAAMISCFMSDSPSILTLAGDRRYKRYFKKYQLATLTNLGTSFAMALIIIVIMLRVEPSIGSIVLAVGMGIVGTIAGSIISTRLMLRKAKKVFGTTDEAEPKAIFDSAGLREVREGSRGQRAFSSILEGAGDGVKTGFALIPGVLIIANLVMLLTGVRGNVYATYDNGQYIYYQGQRIILYANAVFTGSMGEGVGLIPWLGQALRYPFRWLFGFDNPDAISIPLTALGSAGAAVGLIRDNAFMARELAAFTAICMFWSGFLSTHVAMMDSMGFKKLAGSSILFHTIGGIAAGIIANYLYLLFSTIFF
ncbi:MAG: nucleoside recognition domain-containing protein [Firmicutes bacterium]|nr:nucleoside recognition domain-containing protein [Bacillota bacterium]